MINALIGLLRGMGLHLTIPFQWTGYSKPMGKDLFALLDAIHIPLGRPEYQPSDGVTHCNAYIAEVCEAYGYKGLNGLLANEIIELLTQSPNWSIVPLERCQELANTGSLIIAGLKADPHGHVCVICPGKPKTSNRWGQVPSVSNVGARVFIGKGLNWAYSDLPKCWAWRQTL